MPVLWNLFANSLPKFELKTSLKYISFILFGIGLWVFRSEITEVVAVLGNREALVSQVEEYGQLGAVVLFIVLILQVIVAALPGHALIVASGYFYGFWIGFLITHSSTVLASQFCYFLARKFGRPLVERLAPAETVDKWTGRAERQGVAFFFFSFNIPIFPSDVMNYVAGLSGLSPRKFFIANFFGRIPCAIIFTLIGSHGFGISPQLILIGLVLTIPALLIWKTVGSKLEQKVSGEPS